MRSAGETDERAQQRPEQVSRRAVSLPPNAFFASGAFLLYHLLCFFPPLAGRSRGNWREFEPLSRVILAFVSLFLQEPPEPHLPAIEHLGWQAAQFTNPKGE